MGKDARRLVQYVTYERYVYAKEEKRDRKEKRHIYKAGTVQ